MGLSPFPEGLLSRNEDAEVAVRWRTGERIRMGSLIDMTDRQGGPVRSLEGRPDGDAALAQLQQLLRDRRDARALKMLALERLTGLGHTTVSRALNGPIVPTRATVIVLANALKMDPDPLLRLWEQAVEAGRQGAGQEPPATRDFFRDLIEQHTQLFAGRQ
ncbi:helix-turn-helix domain-containing protein, partial [Streptomyces sp. NPDC055134]